MQFGTLPKPSVLNWGTEYRPDQCYSPLKTNIECVLYELIHEQLPLPVPCYDLFPVTELTVGPPYGEISGTPGSLELTGGEYKTWERIHRGMADPRLLAIPASWGRVAALNPNWRDVYTVCSELPRRVALSSRLYYVCSPRYQGSCWPGVILSFLPALNSQIDTEQQIICSMEKAVPENSKLSTENTYSILHTSWRLFLTCALSAGRSRVIRITHDEGCARYPT